MTLRAPTRILLVPLITGLLFATIGVVPASASPSTGARHFRLLAIEIEYDSCRMRSAQFLIHELLRYSNWNNATQDYVSHIHFLSMYTPNEVDDDLQPFLRGPPLEANVKNEVETFLGQASPGEIVLFYYCGHGSRANLLLPDGRVGITELDDWLFSGGLPQAFVTVILDTCYSGTWIANGEGTPFGSDRITLTACRSGQHSYGWCSHWSWFTYIGLLEGFQFAADSNEDGWISAAEDFTYAKSHTESYALQHGLTQTPTSYFGILDGDIPLVQRDPTKAFPLWDVAIIHVDISTDAIIAGSTVTIVVVVENQGAKMWSPSVSVYYNSTCATSQTLTLSPGEVAALSLPWNTSGTHGGTYMLTVFASPGPGEIDLADNTFFSGVIEVHNALVEVEPQNLKLRSKGAAITCYIELPQVFAADVHDINVSSIKLEGAVPAQDESAIVDYDSDGILELMVKFEREATVSYILSKETEGYITGFSRWVTLHVTGRLFSGTPFEGYDTTKVTFHPPWQELKK